MQCDHSLVLSFAIESYRSSGSSNYGPLESPLFVSLPLASTIWMLYVPKPRLVYGSKTRMVQKVSRWNFTSYT